MIYLKSINIPKTNEKCIKIGNSVIVLNHFEYVITKYPQDLTSNTSDPMWELSYLETDMTVLDSTEMYYVFDGSDATYWRVKQTLSGMTYTLLEFKRTDNVLFMVSKVSYYGYMNSVNLCGIKKNGAIEMGFTQPINDNSVEGLHTIEFEPISVCGLSILSVSGGGTHEIKLYNLKVE